ncbi:V-type ATP synthase subunit F [bacterium]|nr:V-type ATP synthase subunit F [bacterium]
MKFYIIGDEDTVLGFRLAGIEGRHVDTPEEAREALDAAFHLEDIGIIVITERTAQSIREQVDRYTYTTTFPLIIEIPDRLGPLEGRGSIREMIRAAVGVHL